MDSKKVKRSIAISIIVIAVTLGNYSRLTGTENIRPIHIVTLLTCGMGIGIFLVNFIMLLRKKD